jgi:hypothetical protein
MLRTTLCLLSALVLGFAYVALSSAPRANAAEGILAPGNPPLTRDVSDASASVTLFMLKHVASGAATASDLSVDPSLLNEWAKLMASEYVTFSGDDQAQLAIMPALRGALADVWPRASASDRAELREAFRPIAEGWLADMSCDGFTSLADAGFVDKTDANVSRYLNCDDDLDSSDTPVVAPAKPTPAPVAATSSSSSASTAASSSMSPTAAAQRASAGLMASHNMYTSMSNVLLQNHVGNMNAILNMGDSNYHYVYTQP